MQLCQGFYIIVPSRWQVGQLSHICQFHNDLEFTRNIHEDSNESNAHLPWFWRIRRFASVFNVNHLMHYSGLPWASCQICKIADCACAGNARNVIDPDIHHGTCVTHVPWCMPWSLNRDFFWIRWRGKTFPAFPAHAQPTILRIW